MQGGVRQHVDTEGQLYLAPDPVGGNRHMRCCLRADVLWFGERHVAVVLDNKAIEARCVISARVGEGALVDRLDLMANVIGGARQRKKMDNSINTPFARPKMALSAWSRSRATVGKSLMPDAPQQTRARRCQPSRCVLERTRGPRRV